MIWPFTRVVKDYQVEMAVLRDAGIEAETLADPDARIPHELAWKLLRVSLEKTGDLALGLHAGLRIEVGDWGSMAYAAANCADLRKAIQYCNRYIKLVDDFGDTVLMEEDDRAIWQFRYALAKPMPAVSDFLVASGYKALARFTGRAKPSLVEVRLVHSEPAYAREYIRVFRAPIRYDAEYNAIVFQRSMLDIPVRRANRDVFTAFDLQTRRLEEELSASTDMTTKVLRLVAGGLERRDVGMREIAGQLHMSVATLRRRLADEKTSHSELIEQVRRESALRYMLNLQISIAEIAARLGFSSATTFGKAFKRWEGVTPVEYRARSRRGN